LRSGSIQVIRAAPPARARGRTHPSSVIRRRPVCVSELQLYHATKWGIEGFVESVAQEVAPFGIACTLIEPGPARTGFGAALVSAEPMVAYDDTPAGTVRRGLADGSFAVRGDAVKMVQAMLACTQQSPAPRRLVLGATAYTQVRAALLARGGAGGTIGDCVVNGDRRRLPVRPSAANCTDGNLEKPAARCTGGLRCVASTPVQLRFSTTIAAVHTSF
jgi:NAD(P)-dependent dehydrogenase (short-subunit alcohol dehydrogenase family)